MLKESKEPQPLPRVLEFSLAETEKSDEEGVLRDKQVGRVVVVDGVGRHRTLPKVAQTPPEGPVREVLFEERPQDKDNRSKVDSAGQKEHQSLVSAGERGADLGTQPSTTDAPAKEQVFEGHVFRLSQGRHVLIQGVVATEESADRFGP